MDDYGINVAKFLYDAAIARTEAAELELSQERFMRRAAEAEVEQLRADHEHDISATTADLQQCRAEHIETLKALLSAEAEVKRLLAQVATLKREDNQLFRLLLQSFATALRLRQDLVERSAEYTVSPNTNLAMINARLADELAAAEDEMEALRDELIVAINLLRGVVDKPLCWYEDICDYLEAAE